MAELLSSDISSQPGTILVLCKQGTSADGQLPMDSCLLFPGETSDLHITSDSAQLMVQGW